MQSNSKKEAQPQTISQLWFVILIITVGWSRYLPLSHPELFNFTPVLALFFISGAYLRGHLSWIGPVIAVIASDLVLNPSYGEGLFEPFTLISIFAYLGIFFLGKSVRSSKKIVPLFVGALGSALLFHGITCGFAWLINPAYAKTISGFWQAQFLGEPGYAPAYLFLRNSIVSTILFSGVFSLIFIINKEKRFFLDKTAQRTKA
jgi:hypothetical protein